MRRRRDLALGAIGLLVLALVLGLLLLRVSSNLRANQDDGAATPWRWYTVEGDRLVIEFEGSPCDTVGANLDEDTDRVVVTAFLSPSGEMCVQTVTGHQVEVQLASPLGDRAVYDGACLEQTEVADDPRCVRRPL